MHKLMATGAEATIDTFHRGRVRSGAHSSEGSRWTKEHDWSREGMPSTTKG